MTRRPQLAALLLAILAALLLVLPHLPAPNSNTDIRVAVYASHAAWFACIVAFTIVVAGACAATPTPRILLAVAALLAVVMALNVADIDVASDLAKIAFGTLAGIAFVRAIERPWWLLPICVLVPIADAWSVFSSRGVTHAVVEASREEPRWLDWPTIATPIAGVPYEAFGRLGIVDVLFLALFVGATIHWSLGIRRAAPALALGLVATSVIVVEGVDVAIPALPLLCVAFLIACAPALIRDARAAMRT
ncbi:MAG: hypothetical protein JWL76_867 [Thermoleophilia bacterium]|nr:hypothetical protein [Thermoleophilia bacterium]